MQSEPTMSKAPGELGETDRLPVETSSLPEEVKQQIVQRLAKVQSNITDKAIVLSIYAIWLAASVFLILLMSTTADFSKETAEDWWLLGCLRVGISLAFLIPSCMGFFQSLKERSNLRAKLIHGK